MQFLLVTGIYPPEIGGPATVIAQLAADLRTHGHRVTVVTYGDEEDEKEGVIRISRAGSAISRYARMMRAVRSRLAGDEIVLATDVFSVGIPVRAALVGKTNRFVLRLGGEWCWEDAVTKGRTKQPMRIFWKNEFRGWRRWISQINYRWIVNRAKRVIVTSDLLRDAIRPLLPEAADRCITVTNLPERNCAMPRSTDAEPRSPLQVLYVGRFAPVKNIPFLARVLKKLSERGVGVAMTFVGDGPDLAPVKTILRDVPDVAFLGRMNAEELQRLYARTDLLALPSLTDICPNSVIEALSCGVPALITTEHGLPKDLRGIQVCSPTDEDAWIEAMTRLREPSVYRELRDAIRVPNATPSALCSILENV